ncbi:alpha/beta fold hydrolase [Beduini massiliensis]|uniref:alpha/beta fold hydrolase n=1 Tax=Beduini massiliensis TaxID=1585974 RepID=UPI00059A897E|nr:alpha/beta hydrolase [Beduini massiliensis]
MYYIRSNDGTKICVEDINPTYSKVIVMVHGWPMSKEMFEYQKNMFTQWGYRIITFDIRGFGDSDISGSGYHYDQLATDLYMVIESTGINNIILLGFSMGGAVCAHYMGMYDNHKVSKLILAGAAAPSYCVTADNPYGHSKDEVNKLIIGLYNDRPNTILEFASNVFASNPSPAFKAWFQGLCNKASGLGTINSAESLRDEDVFSDLGRIKVPTAIMHGKLDKICPYGFAAIMNQQIPGSVLYPFEKSGHGIFYDELSAFNHALMKFIEGI